MENSIQCHGSMTIRKDKTVPVIFIGGISLDNIPVKCNENIHYGKGRPNMSNMRPICLLDNGSSR